MEYKDFIKELFAYIGLEFNHLGKPVLHKIIRNNLQEEALYLKMDSGAQTPSIPLGELYTRFSQGDSLIVIKEKINEIFRVYATNDIFDYAYFNSFDNARYRILFKLIHYQKNELLLRYLPHRQFLDLAIVYYILLEEHRTVRIAPLVTHQHLGQWGLSLADLHQLAVSNTQMLLPFTFWHLSQFLDKASAAFMPPTFIPSHFSLVPDSPFFLLTNKSGFNGAACMLYQGVLETFAEVQKSDILILPSSINEVLLIPEAGMDPIDYHYHIRKVNAYQLPEKYVLSDNLYKYSRHEKRIIFAD